MGAPSTRSDARWRDDPSWGRRRVAMESWAGGPASAPCWTSWSRPSARARAGRWCCGARPGSGRRRCWSTWSSRRRTLTVVRAVGVESEMELAFASLHQLCAPMLDRLERLPDPQRQALEIVFGLSAGAAPDRFLVGLGGAEPAVGGGRGAAAAVRRRRRAVAGSGLGADAGLRGAAAAGRAGRDRVRRARAGRRASAPARAGGAGPRDGDARALLDSAVRFVLDERVRDRIIAETPRQPARAARAAARVDARRSWRAGSACSGCRRSRAGSRRATCAGSRRCPRTRGCCCWSRRPSRSAIRCCSGARPSGSGSRPRRSRRRRTGCWRSASA